MTMPETTQSDLVAKLKALDGAATAGDLSTAERHIAEEHIECPVCQGDGEVLAADYCNIDGKALGVQFYGIGGEFGAHEALWTFLRNAVPEIIAMATENDRLRSDSERLQKIESQIDGGRFEEWPTETFVGQLRMQSRDNLDPEFSQFMAATATHMAILSGQCDAQREIADRAKEDAARLRAQCEAMAKALGLYTCHPCPICNGDCSSAMPPVLNCPTEAAVKAFRDWDAFRGENANVR